MATSFRDFLLDKLSESGFYLDERGNDIAFWSRSREETEGSIILSSIDRLTVQSLSAISVTPRKRQTPEQAFLDAVVRRHIRASGFYSNKKKLRYLVLHLVRWVREHEGVEESEET